MFSTSYSLLVLLYAVPGLTALVVILLGAAVCHLAGAAVCHLAGATVCHLVAATPADPHTVEEMKFHMLMGEASSINSVIFKILIELGFLHRHLVFWLDMLIMGLFFNHLLFIFFLNFLLTVTVFDQALVLVMSCMSV